MIALYVDVPYASFRKSYARSLAETYPFPPPATVYGMLLSLVGEWFRSRHTGVELAFAYKKRPKVATTLRKLSRYKYGVSSKQKTHGNAPDFIETLCDIEFICWINSSNELQNPTLETRIINALEYPERINRKGVVALGLNDDAVNDIALLKFNQFQESEHCQNTWYWLIPCDNGNIELPLWVDHIGSIDTRWQRYRFDSNPSLVTSEPSFEKFVPILDPR
ncbi:CRISPR-associated protein DevS (plasmid) [Gloeothece citriformis PCC 7424]|uniref:CRISPR-associated protein DevS n=1 Tax=Gloeothece citriformis (strain PCC 7424) TaxID=65393 RepID=B7KMR7_GLOC7|nr:type I-MYXAN CRISPR-associated protein Cas5/Cmx5/DevS [Gloeothece citriformis]ACK74089.1 CRISPR-associated protein DevS [Gloeothece citriformis PCC 7424]